MRSAALKTLGFLSLALLVCGCTAKPGQSAFEQGVVGPDLSRQGPFAAASRIVLDEPPSKDPEATHADDFLMHITIDRQAAEDVATLVNVISSRPYLAGVTYHAFLPIVAETNTGRKDYWIIGLNASRTPDRSVYTVLRFPHGLKLEPGTTSDDFEYLTLTCADLEVARMADYAIEDENGKPRGEPLKLTPAPAPEAGDCEYNSLKEAVAVTPLIFGNYDRLQHVDNGPKSVWKPLHVEIS